MTPAYPTSPDETLNAAGGYGPPPGGGGGYGPPPGGGYGGPPGGYGPPGGGYGGPPGGYGPPGGGFPPPGGPMMPGAGGEVNTTLPLVLNILATLFCCGFGTIPGVLGLVFSIQAGKAKQMGDFETARGKAKIALILAIAAYALQMVGGAISYVVRDH